MGGHAAYFAKHMHSVRRAVLLSGPLDANASCSWAGSDIGRVQTPASDFAALAHVQEAGLTDIRANLAAMGVPPPEAFVIDTEEEAVSNPGPWQKDMKTRVLETRILPRTGLANN